MEEVTSKKARVRKAEKDRKFSSCKFADRIFLCVATKLDEIVKAGYWPQDAVTYRHNVADSMVPTTTNVGNQNVTAAILLHDSQTDQLRCLSIGIGTKFIEKIYGHPQGNFLTDSILSQTGIGFHIGCSL